MNELIEEADDEERPWRELARVAFLTLVLTGVRRFELQSLRWGDVDLVENVLRVVDSKTEDGIRSIALPSSLAEARRSGSIAAVPRIRATTGGRLADRCDDEGRALRHAHDARIHADGWRRVP